MDSDQHRRLLVGIAGAIVLLLCLVSSIVLFLWLTNSGNCVLIKLHPKTQRQHDLVAAFYHEQFFDLHFVKPPVKDAMEDLTIYVPHRLVNEFGRFLNDREGGIPFEITKETPYFELNIRTEEMALGTQNSYSSIVTWMIQAKHNFKGLTETFSIGWTHEKREIIGVKITSPSNATKRVIWIDGGIHAREWESVHAVVYMMHQLVTGYDVDKVITKYMDMFEFYILPVVNPDGYEFTRETIDNRLWRKNKSPARCNATGHCCQGVDLNRNWDVFWGVNDASTDPCNRMFQGTSPFSEPETSAIRDKLQSQELRGRVSAFITMHTFGQLVLYADRMGNTSLTLDTEDFKRVGQEAAEAIANVRGTTYRTGTAADLIYKFAGSHDWAGLIAGVPYSYCIEMVPRYNNQTADIGFMLPKNELIPTAREAWEGVKTIIDAAMNKTMNH